MRQGAGPLHPSWPGVGGGQARLPLLPCHWGGSPRPPPRCCPGRQSRLPGRPRCAPSAPACPPAWMRPCHARPHSSACAALARLALRTSGIRHAPRAGLPPVLRAGSSGVRHAMALAGRAFARLPAPALAALPAGPLAADRGRYSASICIWPSTLMSRPDSCAGSCLLRFLVSRSFALSSSRSAFIFS